MGVVQSASNGLSQSQKILMDGLGTQLVKAQNVGSELVSYIENEVIPNVQRLMGEACDNAIALYEDHVATAMKQNVLPLYNDHVVPVYNELIYPVYKEHVSPIVKTIEKEAVVVIEASQKEAQKARSEAATLVKQSSTSAIKMIEEKQVDGMLPSILLSILDHSSKDGEWAVDRLWKGFIILAIILCRSLVFRVVGAILSLIWFFCPLRLFVGRGESVEKESDNGKNVTFTTK